MMSSSVSDDIADQLNPVLRKIKDGDKELSQSAAMAYQAFLGYYLGQVKRTSIRNKEEVVSIANDISAQMGLSEIPGLDKRLIRKMGLNGVAGIHLTGGDRSK